jgi:hypothetical protein
MGWRNNELPREFDEMSKIEEAGPLERQDEARLVFSPGNFDGSLESPFLPTV